MYIQALFVHVSGHIGARTLRHEELSPITSCTVISGCTQQAVQSSSSDQRYRSSHFRRELPVNLHVPPDGGTAGGTERTERAAERLLPRVLHGVLFQVPLLFEGHATARPRAWELTLRAHPQGARLQHLWRAQQQRCQLSTAQIQWRIPQQEAVWYHHKRS